MIATKAGDRPTPTYPTTASSVERAELRIVAECMHRHGFDYPEAEIWRFSQHVRSVQPPAEHPFGVDDLGWATAHGFGSDVEASAGAAMESARAGDPLTRLLAGMPSAEVENFGAALYGADSDPEVKITLPDGFTVSTHTRGCQAEAREALYRDQRSWLEASAAVQVIPAQAVKAALADKSFRATQKAWSACMGERGHQVRDAVQLRTSFVSRSHRLTPDDRRSLEIRLAVDEARCSQRTGLVALGERLRHKALTRLRLEHRASMAELARLETVAAGRASQILARGGEPAPNSDPAATSPRSGRTAGRS